MSAPLWFAHRLNDWSKLAKERVKRATDGSQDSTTNLSDSKTSTSSDDGSMQRDSQKSTNSSFEVQSSHLNQIFFFLFMEVHCSSCRNVLKSIHHNHHRQCFSIKVNHFLQGTSNERQAYRAKVA